MKTFLYPKLALTLAWTCVLVCPARAALIVNGGFESGFTGWTRVDQLGSEGTFALQTGTLSPVSGTTVPAPTGTSAAMTDAFGPGSHVLYQDFVVTGGLTNYTLAFSLFINNGAGTFSTPSTLDFATPALNQRLRVDIVSPTANSFTLAAGDILQPLFETTPGSPAVSGYTAMTFDVTSLFQANQGSTLRLRFAQVDNVAPFLAGVDNVDVRIGGTASVPDTLPVALSWLTMLGVLSIAARYHRKTSGVGA